MKFSRLTYISLAAILLASSCERLTPSTPPGEGDALQISIVSGNGETKSAKDGDLMNNLRVWMVKDGESVVDQYASLTPGAASATVSFDPISRGDYTIYIVANSTALGGYVKGSTIDDAFLKQTLPVLVDKRPPFTDETGMPLSLVKKVSVGPGVNRISAELLRVCGRIRITLLNKTADKAIFLSVATLNDQNPSSGYLFFADHAVPAGTTYGPFASQAGTIRIAPGEEDTVLDQYLYESGKGTETLRLKLKGGLFPGDVTSVTEKPSYEAGVNGNTYSAGKRYLIANKSDQRFFLKADTSGVGLEYVGEDNELLAKTDIENYLWSFSSSGTSPQIRNIGQNKYLQLDYNSASLSNFATTVNTSTTTDGAIRFFYYYSSYYTYYLYNNNGTVAVSRYQSGQTAQWYLREVTTNDRQLFVGAIKDIVIDEPVTYIDDYGTPVPLNDICRNDAIDIKVHVFYNETYERFYFEVQPWDNKNSDTTFD